MSVTRIDLPYYGRWMPQGATADEALRHSSLDPAALEALVAGAVSEHPASPIGILKLHPDSGCTGSNTPHLHLLANHRPCDEIYSQANGNISRCEAIGDLPVIVRNKQGATVQLTFTNVRCVPCVPWWAQVPEHPGTKSGQRVLLGSKSAARESSSGDGPTSCTTPSMTLV
jgi:hypothetical protein